MTNLSPSVERVNKLKRISLRQSADGNVYIHDLVWTLTTIQNKIDEIIEFIQYEREEHRKGKKK